MSKTKAVLTRFIKGFIAGGISSLLVLIQSGVPFTTWHNLLTLFGTAFITGGLLMVEKLINWTDIPISQTYEPTI